ncbi:MAG: hypothetical protein GC164_03210 [Phycisphaera sp.]|nr:hypothetical protein [Phycisphaera sp.]
MPVSRPITPEPARGAGLRCDGLVAMAFALLALSGLAGCESYRLAGVVMGGDPSTVVVVGKGDGRLLAPGLGGATIEFTIDPTSMHPQKLATVIADDQGHFEVPVDVSGAGFLEYELGVLCRLPGYRTLWTTLDMPASGKRLVLVMKPGRDSYSPQKNLIDETMEMGRQLQQR